MSKANNQALPNYYLERYAVDDLPEDLHTEVANQIAKNPALVHTLDTIKKENSDYLTTFPVDDMVADIQRKYAVAKAQLDVDRKHTRKYTRKHTRYIPQKSTPIRFAWAGGILTFLIAVGIFIMLQTGTNVMEPDSSVRVKGDQPYLLIFRKDAHSHELLKNLDYIKDNDELQISYVGKHAAYGAIFSIDGRGYVTWHFPDAKNQSLELEDTDGKTLLDFAIRIDDAPSFERFFFITSDQAFKQSDIQAAIHRLAEHPDKAASEPLDIPDSFQQFSIKLLKEDV